MVKMGEDLFAALRWRTGHAHAPDPAQASVRRVGMPANKRSQGMQRETVHLQACRCMDSLERVLCGLPEKEWRVASFQIAAKEGMPEGPHCIRGEDMHCQLP